MTNRWKQTTLGEVLTLQRGFDLPQDERVPGKYPVIASTGQVGTHQVPAVEGPGVVVGRSGSIGGGQYIKEDFWPLNTSLWVKDFKGNNRRFCYYLLRSLDLSNFNAGSGVPTLNRNHIHPMPVMIPEVVEQEFIAHVLGTLDDKIELNRRMNRTLEEMARAIFQDWFVDFGPTRAKIEGQEPYLPPELWDLFPDRLVDSELGEIPEGWEMKPLSEFASLNPESWSKVNFPDEIEYVDLANTKWGTIESTPLMAWKSAPSRARRILKPGDTIVGTVRPGNGSYSFVGRDGLTGSTGFAVLRPLSQHFRELVYLAATDPTNIQSLTDRADGAAYPAVRPEVVGETIVVTPIEGISLLDCFSKLTNPQLDMIEKNQAEARTFVGLREELLPSLLSGESNLGYFQQDD